MLFKKKKDKGSEEKDESEDDKKEEEATPEETKGEGEEGAEGEGGEGAPRKGKRKIILIAGGAVVLILLIVGGLFAAGVFGGGAKKEETAKGTPEIAKPVYYELPQFLVNLSNAGTGNRVTFLKMSVTLELRDQAAVGVIDANKPRIIDVFNTYLRELRPADIQGSAGIYRLRDELLTRINGTVQEGVVKDILFSEIIVQ